MLISEYIEDIFTCASFEGEKEKALLLAKEFPIQGYNVKYYDHGQVLPSDSHRSPSVDYLVGKGNTLYLVELKTDHDSYDDFQAFRMLMAKKRGVAKLGEHYRDVVKATNKPRKYLSWAGYLLEKTKGGPIDQSREIMSGLEDVFCGYKKIEIVYLTLDDYWRRIRIKTDQIVFDTQKNRLGLEAGIRIITGNAPSEKLYQLSLTDFDLKIEEDYNIERKKTWELIKDILYDLKGIYS